MDEFSGVHQCLFCHQTFRNAADKDDHVLQHFAQETCTECNQHLIRIGGYLYTRHNQTTCIKKTAIPEEHIESCTSIDAVVVKTDPLQCSCETTMPATMRNIKREPADQHENEENLMEFNELESTAHENDPQLLISNDSFAILSGFPNMNLNPVVLLEDVLKKTDMTRHKELEIKKEIIAISGHEHECDDEHVSTERDGQFKGRLSTRKNQKKIKKRNIPILQPKIFECFICHKVMKSERSVASHIKNFHRVREKRFKCEQCGLSFIHNAQLKYHIKIVHLKIRAFVCSECGKSFKSKGTLRSHEYVHTGHRPFHCSIDGCDKRFTTKQSLVRHLDVKHGIHSSACKCNACCQKAVIRKYDDTQTPKYTQTNGNDATTRNNTNHRQSGGENNVGHIKTEGVLIERRPNGVAGQQQTEHKCDYCDQMSATYEAKQSHMMQFHNEAAEFACKACPKRFFHKYYLHGHMARAHGKKHKCDMCGLLFNCKSRVQRHIDVVHLNKRKFECEYCGLTFKYKIRQINHVRSFHTGERPFQCEFDNCGERFVSRQALVWHERLHRRPSDYVRNKGGRPKKCKTDSNDK